MRHVKSIFGIILLLIWGLSGLKAQESIHTAGGNASGAGGSVSYSIGQLVYTTNSTSSGSVSQGVQQPFEISIITGIRKAKDISLNFSAYPNPTTDFLILKIENYKYTDLTYSLYDLGGKLIENRKIISDETQVEMSRLIPAVYFLKLINDSKEVKTFKIIKN
jgi:hypothetical protein